MDPAKKVTVIFQPSGQRGRIDKGRTLLEAAQMLGIDIHSICGGKRTCGKCKVRIQPASGILSLHPLPPITPEEEKLISPKEQEEGFRLACATSVEEDCYIFLPEKSPQVIRKEVREMAAALDPAVKGYFVELDPPTLENPEGDFERLLRALQNRWGLKGLTIDVFALQSLPNQVRAGKWKVTVFVWMDREIIDLQPGEVQDYYGAAIDIGTTTMAIYLCNLSNGQTIASDAIINPQVVYGEDVMSRITYTVTHGMEGLRQLQEIVLRGLGELIQSVCQKARILPNRLMDLTIVGNTAMHHLFLGIDPQFVGVAPFPPAIHQSIDLKARDLRLPVHPAAYIHVLPIEAGFVGADNVGVLISQRPYEKEEMILLLDIGTNGEIILGNRQRLLSCSCATGPAFEGGHLRFGMRAALGAIERVRIDRKSLELRFKVIGQERWSNECPPQEIQARGICGSGIIEALAEMFKAGLITPSGRFSDHIPSPRWVRDEQGKAFVIAWPQETAIGQAITVSLGDIRAIQLAKGALYAGANILMKILGVTQLDRVILAGGFGSMIDGEMAMVLGMFPDCDPKCIVAVGNAAGDGARIALLNRGKRLEASWIARKIEYVELTTRPDFTQAFIEALSFPHEKDPFPHLEALRGSIHKSSAP